MKQHLGAVTVVVRDYDEAIAYYTGVLGFRLAEDVRQKDDKRWVLVTPPGSVEGGLLLAKAKNPAEQAAIGAQTGGRVFLFLHTDDFWRDYHAFQRRGVQFLESPRVETYGTVAVFLDLYGNRWDLLQNSPVEKPGLTQALQPETVVQRQLEAYNERDLEALLAIYTADAELFEHPSKLVARGTAELRQRFSLRFQEPNLHAALLKRIVAGTTVIDHERVSRTFPDGPGEIDVVMIYEVSSGRIARAWSIIGEKKLLPQS